MATIYICDMKRCEKPPFMVVPSVRDISQNTALLLEAFSTEAIKKRGTFTLILSGGRTPDTLFTLLATPEWRNRIDWSATRVFWADERCVPPDNDSSNYKKAHNLLLSHVTPAVVCRIKGELPPEDAAHDYERQLMQQACLLDQEGAGSAHTFPRFDCILLGMGADGHTASIFPGESAEHETRHTAVAQYVTTLESWRVTITLPTINNARECIFLIAGKDKKDMLQKVASPAGDLLPVQRVLPVAGNLYWYVDAEAAQG